MRKINIENEIVKINKFICDTLHDARFNKLIVGLSGGIDSALTATLCKEAMGKDSVIGIMMPYKNSHPDSFNHAKILADFLEISYFTVPVTDMVDAYFDKYETEADSLRRGNRMARERMCILYDFSAKYNALVVGTSNKSEIYAGYCTQFGDSACAFEPLAHLYKTEVKEISRFLKIPHEIINKAPTADLWDGQTDEQELGITYPELDKILYYYLDEKRDKDYILAQGVSEYHFELVMRKIKNSAFKRRLPLTMEDVWEV